MRILPKDRDLGWTPFAWLIYLAMFFVDPVLSEAGALEWTLTAAAIGVFLPLYFLGYWLRGRRLWMVIFGMAVIGMLCVPFNQGASVFFVYAAAALGGLGRVRQGLYGLGAIVGLLLLESMLVGLGPGAWVPGMVFALLIGGINIHFGEIGRRNVRLKLAQEEVESLAKLDERERIARDLHDLLGHSLSMITLKSELAARLLEGEPVEVERAAAEIRDVEDASRQAMSQVRRAVRGYRAQKLSTEVAKCRMTLVAAGIYMDFRSTPYDLDPDQESAVALALREAVTNVVRHAKADTCRVRLRSHKASFELEVEDDGRGSRRAEGSGLTGMRERVEALGGEVALESAGRGTRVRVRLPTGRSMKEQSQPGALGRSA